MVQGPSQNSSSELGREQPCITPLSYPPNIVPTGLLQSTSAAWLADP